MNKGFRKERIILILAALFYILVSVGFLAANKSAVAFVDSDDLFNAYGSFIFGKGEQQNADEDPSAKIDNSNLFGSDEVTEEEVKEGILTEDEEEPAMEEPSEETAEPSETAEEAEPSDTLEEEPEPEEAESEPDDGKKYYSFSPVTGYSKNINVRQAPSISAKVVCRIPKGETGYVLETGDEWTKVYYDGNEGYCSNEVINLKEISKEEYESR